MNIDQPLTVYKKDDDSTTSSAKKEHKPTRAQMEDVVRKWKERKAKGQGVKLSDFLGGAEPVTSKSIKH